MTGHLEGMQALEPGNCKSTVLTCGNKLTLKCHRLIAIKSLCYLQSTSPTRIGAFSSQSWGPIMMACGRLGPPRSRL